MPNDQREFIGRQLEIISIPVPTMPLQSMDENNFSISRDDFPRNFVHVALFRDVAALVSPDGQIRMGFLRRLTPGEKRLIRRLQDDVRRAKQQTVEGEGSSNLYMNQTTQNLTQPTTSTLQIRQFQSSDGKEQLVRTGPSNYAFTSSGSNMRVT